MLLATVEIETIAKGLIYLHWFLLDGILSPNLIISWNKLTHIFTNSELALTLCPGVESVPHSRPEL